MLEKAFKNQNSAQLEMRVALLRIKAIKNITFGQLAKDAGISYPTIYRFLCLEKDLSKTMYARLCDYVTAQRI